MILPLLGIIFFFILYRLFIQGVLLRLIIAGTFLLITPFWLMHTFPGTFATIITIGGVAISWAWAIPITILILTLATTRTSQ
jgi:hypothetical protein